MIYILALSFGLRLALELKKENLKGLVWALADFIILVEILK